MNIYTDYNIDYDNHEQKLFVKVMSEKDKFLGILMEKSELVLEVHYDKKLQQFLLLEGSLGNKLASSSIDNSEKLHRVLEVLNNKLWDYFNKQQPTRIKP